jgi:hypothetical protein
MDRGAAGEMEIPHRECFLSSVCLQRLWASRMDRSGRAGDVLGIFLPARAMAGMPMPRQGQCAEFAGLCWVSPARPA